MHNASAVNMIESKQQLNEDVQHCLLPHEYNAGARLLAQSTKHQYAWQQFRKTRLAQKVAVSCTDQLVQVSARAQLHHNVHCVLFCVALIVSHLRHVVSVAVLLRP